MKGFHCLPAGARPSLKHYSARAQRSEKREIRHRAERGDIEGADAVQPAKARKGANLWHWD